MIRRVFPRTSRDIAIRKGIETALGNEFDPWKEAYLQCVADFLRERRGAAFNGGQVCAYCRKRGMREPHHHNVWGAMLSTVEKVGWIEKLGYVTPTTSQTHIGKVVLWRGRV